MRSKSIKIIDEITPDIGLKPTQRSEIAQHLETLLATTYVLYLKTLYYHWNVTGPHFFSLHTFFQSEYEALHKAGDALAERLRALGHMSPGTTAEFRELSTIQEDEALPKSAQEMVQNLLHDNEHASLTARKVLEKAQSLHDEVTADMMIARMTYHDKAAWMLRSTLA
ncbi:MAG: DNA starvation/stationary phase protection protein [Rickettsiales bacterium]|nr:DNA starvation/stationary phase protection protein [Rickettsiales bacterium]